MTTYKAATLNKTFEEGQTADISGTVPITVSLSGKTLRYQVRDNQGDLILEKLSPAKITVVDQAFNIPYLPADTRGKAGTYNHELDAVSTDGTYEQPLFRGVLTLEKENSKP